METLCKLLLKTIKEEMQKKIKRTKKNNKNNNKLLFYNVHSISTKKYQISRSALFFEEGK